MKTGSSYLILIASLLLGIYSCSKRVNPSAVAEITGKKYDIAAFNYVYVEAIKQKLMNNVGDALQYLEQCVKINPESDAVYFQMAQILSSNGDVKNGKQFIKKALSIDPQNIWYLRMLAGFYYEEKNLDSAIICFEKAVEYFPDKEDIQLTLGNLYSENRNFEKAQTVFDNFDKKYGINESSTISSIKALMMANRFDEALVKAKLLIKEYPDEVLFNDVLAEIYSSKGESEKAREVYNQLLERNPNDPQAQLSISDFLIDNKNYSELFSILDNVILNGSIKREDKIKLFARLIELPDLIKEQKDNLIISMMVFEASNKEDDIVPLLRPELMIKLSELNKAALRLEEIVKENPGNYYAWEKLLLVYYQMKDYKSLMARGEECATRFNRSILAKLLYANGALENKNYDVALEELRKADILAGNDKEYYTQILTMRAEVYYRMKNYIKAFETFEQAIKSDSEDLTVINNYAYYLAEQDKNLKEAEEMAKKVIQKEKDNTTYLDTYGWVLYKRGKLNEAAKVMETVINSGGKPDAEWFEHYGFILKKQKKCSKAIENWNMALKLDSTKTNLLKEIENCIK